MLSNNISNFLQDKIADLTGKATTLLNLTQIHGGDINETYQVKTNTGDFFLKLNSDARNTDFFAAEADGLESLSGKSELIIPKPLFHGNIDGNQFLLMEFLPKGIVRGNFWENFGRNLAILHKNANPQFGWSEHNYIGMLPQKNNFQHSWNQFYAESRVLFLVYSAASQNDHYSGLIPFAEKFCSRLENIIPEETPALLHGDLWSGNFMVHETGQAAVFDPSVYFGHREMDLAMTRLFGGFHTRFYQAYDEEFPLTPGWEERIPIFQLYPLLVHMVLFGGHYYDSVKSILKKFS
ncbi:fructosamine kinase family protein [Pollutibacter soli]|uniref:fructosamine kinase family protein n=1 Tax=Pollutibacter soli TaxID=3034157 RepID=UPI0030137756